MKTAKKVLALLLSVLMVFTMVSSSVAAVAETTPTEKTQLEDVENKADNIFSSISGIIDGVHNLVGGIMSVLGKECVFCDEVHTKAETDDEDTQEPTEPETPPSEPEVPVEPEEPTEPETPVEPEEPKDDEATEDKIDNAFDSIGGLFDSIHNLVGSILAIFGKECPFCDKVHGENDVEEDKEDVTDKPDEDGCYTVTFDFNYDGAPEAIKQKVKGGECAIVAELPERKGYAFIGWYISDEYIEPFNFAESVNKNYNLYARWVDMTDKTDTDNDGLSDAVEDFFYTNVAKDDTDDDGLTDYVEIMILALNPNYKDTDGDFIEDGDEDSDSDGLSNKYESKISSNPASKDTDGDGLSDQEEVKIGTDPCLKDTDMDYASDKKEIEVGTDPLVAQTKFDITVACDDNSNDIKAFVDVCLTGKQVDSLSVSAVEDEELFPTDMPGYLGKAFEFKVEGSFDEAVLKFEFDDTKLNYKSKPTIYYFNEDKQLLEEMNTEIEGNVAKTSTTHFSKYILLDRTVYEESFSWIDVWDSSQNYTGVELVLVIDDSGSMTSNDKSYQRLNVAQNLINGLPKNSKIGIVKFASSTSILTSSLTVNKETAKSYLTTSYFKSSGGTYMYEAINSAFGLFETTDEAIMKVVVVLSDGETSNTGKHSATVSAANSKNIKIYTVGLGNSTSYFNSYLKPLAANTGGVFYLASNAGELTSIYDNISQKIDIETDSDGDGIPDYYEDNLVTFAGVDIKLDKNNSDTDNDGYLDGEEVELKYEYNEDKTKVKVTGKIISSPDKKRKFTTVAYDIPKNRVLQDINMNIKEIHPFLGFTSAMMELSTDASNMLENVPVALDVFGFVSSWVGNSVSITQLKVTTSKDNTMAIKYGSSIELNLSGKKTSLSSLLVDRLYSYNPSIVFNSNEKADECIRNWFGLTGSGKYSMQLDFGRVYVGDYGYYLLYEGGDFYQVPIIHEDTTMYVYYKEGKEVTKMFDAASLLRGVKIKLPESEKAKVLEQLKKNGFEPA